MITINMKCPFCGQPHSVDVPDSEYHNWRGGQLAQNALTSLTVTEREQLISQICLRCQREVFGEEG